MPKTILASVIAILVLIALAFGIYLLVNRQTPQPDGQADGLLTQGALATPAAAQPIVAGEVSVPNLADRPDGSFILDDTDVLAGVCTNGDPVRGEVAKALLSWAAAQPIARKDAFVRTVLQLSTTGSLPSCYMRREEFDAQGWPQDELWSFARGRAIGGDPYTNQRGLLPRRHNGSYRQAELDFYRGIRSSVSLVYVPDGPNTLIWVSMDGQNSFIPVNIEGEQ